MPNFARLPAGPSLAMLGLFVSLQAWAADDREALWRQDLKFMESEFAAHQLDFGKLYPRFHEEVAELGGEVGKLSDSEMVSRVMKMVSSANVGHNIVFLPARQLGFQPIPFMLACEAGWRGDGGKAQRIRRGPSVDAAEFGAEDAVQHEVFSFGEG